MHLELVSATPEQEALNQHAKWSEAARGPIARRAGGASSSPWPASARCKTQGQDRFAAPFPCSFTPYNILVFRSSCCSLQGGGRNIVGATLENIARMSYVQRSPGRIGIMHKFQEPEHLAED